MRAFLAIGILTLGLAPLHADDTGDRTTTVIADALDWYSVWFASGPSVTDASGVHGLASNTYDYYPLQTVSAYQHDDVNYGAGMPYRGNVTNRETPSGTSSSQYNT